MGGGSAAAVRELPGGWVAWLAGPLLGADAYVVVSGLEMAHAHSAPQKRESEKERD